MEGNERKRKIEEHRVAVFGENTGHPTVQAATFMSEMPPISTTRVVVAIDIDCFYAQVEKLVNKDLMDKPVGVQQQHIVVTCDYQARELGITKLMSAAAAREKCPELVLVNGEDLTEYREANESLAAVVRAVCGEKTNIEKLGLDEFFIDATAVVNERIQKKSYEYLFEGHVYPPEARCGVSARSDIEAERMLMVASQLARELRRRILQDTGLTCCAGVASNKMLAKFAATMHKPNAQTSMFPSSAAEYIAGRPLRKLPGVGWKWHSKLSESFGDKVHTVGDLRASYNLPQLEDMLGPLKARWLWQLAAGEDSAPVKNTEMTKIVSVEDSFRLENCWPGVHARLNKLCGELRKRLEVDQRLHSGREPRTFRICFRYAKRRRESRSSPFPDSGKDLEAQAKKLLVKSGLKEPFHLTLLGVGATNFVSMTRESARLDSFFKKPRLSMMSCPLCHTTLSGQSNADLNRHIDQCLQVREES